MISGTGNREQGSKRPVGGAVSAVAMALLCFLVSEGWGWGQRGGHAVPSARAAARASAPERPSVPPAENSNTRPRPEMRPGVSNSFRSGTGIRPGQEHLPQWLNQHQNLSPAQQENLLRREPGFTRLSPEQQQRVMNRLRLLDSRPPAQRARMLARNEAFERLSPEGKQQVRAAAHSLDGMPQDRQRLLRRAFNDLRQIPPRQRGEILNSARFTHSFSPEERHVLGSLLSIEPYQPH